MSKTRDYPSQHVEKAAASYAQDFERIIGNGDDDLAKLSWNCRLADASAQQIRYWLRTVLNPVPDRAPQSDKRSGWNCRVSEIVSMEMDDESKIAIDDGSLSSLVSDAISHIYDYFGDDDTRWQEKMEARPTKFCRTDLLCLRGIVGKSQRGHKLSIDDWMQIGREVELVTGFLAAVNGVQFLHDLFCNKLTTAAVIVTSKLTLSKVRIVYCGASLASCNNSNLALFHVAIESELTVQTTTRR
jgi:hypothetical protein